MKFIIAHIYLILAIVSISGVSQYTVAQNGIQWDKEENGACNASVRFFNQTTPICDSVTLDAYCIDMMSAPDYTPHPWPGCPNITLHDPSWVSFVAGANSMELEFIIGNCELQTGVQIAVYELPCTYSYVSSRQEIHPAESVIGFPLSSCFYAESPQFGQLQIPLSTTPGQLYGILIDGFNADLCQVEINVQEGADAPGLPLTPFDSLVYNDEAFGYAKDTLCKGAEDVLFTLYNPIPDACSYVWTLNGEPESITSTNETSISFWEEGVSEVCVYATNFCDTTEPVCIDIPVQKLDTTIVVYDTICQGDVYSWTDPAGNIIGVYGPFQNFAGDTQFISENRWSTLFYCEVNTELNLYIRSENHESPTRLDTFTCFTDLPFKLHDTYFTGPVNDHLVHTQSSSTGCDTFFNVGLTVFGGSFYIQPRCINSSEKWEFSLYVIDNPLFYQLWEDQLEIFGLSDDFSLETIWTINHPSFVVGESLELELTNSQLEEFADNDTIRLQLDMLMKHNGEMFCAPFIPMFEFNVNDLPVLDAGIQSIGDTLLLASEVSAQYQWVNCDSNFQAIIGENSRLFKPMKAGNYAVVLEENFCRDTSDCMYISPLTSSINAKIEDEVRIFPNPSTDHFSIQNLPHQWVGEKYRIYSSTGKVVTSGELTNNKKFDVSTLPAGVYYVQFVSSALKICKL